MAFDRVILFARGIKDVGEKLSFRQVSVEEQADDILTSFLHPRCAAIVAATAGVSQLNGILHALGDVTIVGDHHLPANTTIDATQTDLVVTFAQSRPWDIHVVPTTPGQLLVLPRFGGCLR